jgi:hypothetical protein
VGLSQKNWDADPARSRIATTLEGTTQEPI